ncbi:MAG: DDE-type integrase/transposase/recombinase [Kiritimatiellia bacterium]
MEDLLPIPAEWPQAEALFRMQMVAPLIDPLSTLDEKTQWRRFVTSREHKLPGGETRRIGERTLRRWVAQYRQAGWQALQRQPRPNRGAPSKIAPQVIERAKQLKLDDPRRSVPHIIRIIETEQEEALGIHYGSLWRHLAKAGLGGRGAAPKTGLRRFESRAPGQLWMADTKHGPYLPDPLRRDAMRKTYLIGFMDDFSRAIMHAEWFWADDIYSLEITFQKALLRKGKPQRVYVDRGLTYQSRVFRTACATLGIRHISATAYHPEGKGKLERYWLNVDNEFLLELEHSPVTTLEELNERFWAWQEEVYHRRVNSQTGSTPLARFASACPPLLEHPEKLAEVFLWRVVRTVDKTGCVSFQGNTYQIETGLEHRKVELRYHPLHLQRLQVWTGERRWADADPVDLQRARVAGVDPRHQLPDKKTPSLYLETLVRRHEARKQQLISPLQLSQDDASSRKGSGNLV